MVKFREVEKDGVKNAKIVRFLRMEEIKKRKKLSIFYNYLASIYVYDFVVISTFRFYRFIALTVDA